MPYDCYALLKMEAAPSEKDCAGEILPDKPSGGVS